MVTSSAKTAGDYLASLPDERRIALEEVRKVILEHLPGGFEEMMVYGMMSYGIPLEKYPNTYNKQPLCVAGLASQKSYMSLYLMTVYGNKDIEKWFVSEYKKSGKKLDMGKSCVHFKKLDDLPLGLVGEVISRVSAEQFIKAYEDSRKKPGVA